MAPKRVALLATIVMALIIVITAGRYVASRWCGDILPAYDSPDLKRDEAREFVEQAREVYDTKAAVTSDPLSLPMSATISGKTATLTIRHGMYAGNLQYAQAWQQVYNKYHKTESCVTLHLVWSDGHMEQHFPPDTTL